MLRLPLTTSKGFTLLEVMVVLAIIGGLLAMVSLTGDNRQAEDQSLRLGQQISTLFNAYRQEAVFQNIDLGVAIDTEGLTLLSFSDINRQEVSASLSREELDQLSKNPWRPYSGSLKNSLELPESMVLALTIEGVAVDLMLMPPPLAADSTPKPVLVFLSADEYTPFSLQLEHEHDQRFLIHVTGDGVNPPQVEVEHFEH